MRLLVVSMLGVAACVGPPASDAALCRDVAHRICNSDCALQRNQISAPSKDCEATLNARTGCDDENFMFDSRYNFISCRAPLVRAGDDVDVPPNCEDIDDMYRACPSTVAFYSPR